MLRILPLYVETAINDAITKALDGRDCDDITRQILFDQILDFYDANGRIPEFTLTPTT